MSEARAAAEAEFRARMLAAFDRACPEVAGNPFIPHWPTLPQARFLGLRAADPEAILEALYGGAAGGGKSDALLMAAAQYAWRHGEFSGLMLRRTYTELAQPDALMDRALRWWVPRGVEWDGSNKVFTFPSGARVKVGYLDHARDELQYQGAAFQLACWDELTHWDDPLQYEFVSLSRVRRPAGSAVPLRALSASNPGGPGHAWVRDRFVTGRVNPSSGVRTPPVGTYVPARLDDNPYIDRAAYEKSLMRLHPTRRQQLRDGDWRAREPGDYFRAEWFGPLLDPVADAPPPGGHVAVRWWDLAASEKESAARTAGVLMVRFRTGVRAVRHCAAFRLTPGARDAAIVRQAEIDGRAVTVGVEIEGGSGGVAQFDSLAERLRARGYRCVGARPRDTARAGRGEAERRIVVLGSESMRAKVGRADPVAACLERGHQRRGECPRTGEPWWGADADLPLVQQRDGLRLYAGAWTQEFLDVVEGFPDGATVDEVDAMSGAWAWLESHPWGAQVAPDARLPRPRDSAELHPDDREEPARPRVEGP